MLDKYNLKQLTEKVSKNSWRIISGLQKLKLGHRDSAFIAR